MLCIEEQWYRYYQVGIEILRLFVLGSARLVRSCLDIGLVQQSATSCLALSLIGVPVRLPVAEW